MPTVMPKRQAEEMAAFWDKNAEACSKLSLEQLSVMVEVCEALSVRQAIALAYRLCARDLREAYNAD